MKRTYFRAYFEIGRSPILKGMAQCYYFEKEHKFKDHNVVLQWFTIITLFSSLLLKMHYVVIFDGIAIVYYTCSIY